MVLNETKHLKTGDAFPTLPDDQHLRLFTMCFCPSAERLHLVLHAKQIPYHIINISINEKPEWYTTINARNEVPTLQLTNEPGTPYLTQSLVIAEYLNDKYPQRPLYPSDPYAKAADRLLVQKSSVLEGAVDSVIMRLEGAIDDYLRAHDTFEAELTQRGTKFFGGAEPGMVDYMVWPWIERGAALEAVVGSELELNSERFGQLIKWKENMFADSAVQNIVISTKDHIKFIESYLADEPEEDLLV